MIPAVVGAGQAGLAVAAALRRRGTEPLVLDERAEVGASWAARYDSLVLFTPSHRSSLPGLSMALPYDTYPRRDQVAAYLQDYAEATGLRPETGTRVQVVRRIPDRAGFRLDTSRGRIDAQRVVIAAGALHHPRIPPFAAALGADVVQLHSSAYRRPSALPDGRVLVVGSGNSGAQIAVELADAGRDVEIAFERLPRQLPQRVLGRDVFDWLHWSGALRRRWGCRGAVEAGSIPLIGTDLPRRLRSGQIRRRDRAIDADRCSVGFADGTRTSPRVVLWATGFGHDWSWIEIPEAFVGGIPRHRRGVSEVPGLAFVGLPCLHSKGSGLLGYVGSDAESVAGNLALV